MGCCKKETKSKAVESECCESKPQEVKPAEKADTSGCGCAGKDSNAKKGEKEKASCC